MVTIRDQQDGHTEQKRVCMSNSKTTKRWSPQEKDRLQSLLDAGKTAPEIAVELGRTPNAIYGLLQRIYRKRDAAKAR
jgi:DNA-binding NarL/FixJ family response regulator